jgi:dihydroorotate dehydrogenase electron transfer subunit
LSPNIYQLDLLAPRISETIVAGQFVMLKLSETYDPFLKRPFGVNGIDRTNGILRFIYFVRGRGTRFLSEFPEGSVIELTGPLGNGWEVNPENHHVLIVGGGSGIAPLLPLSKELHSVKIETDILLGATTGEALFDLEEFKKCGYMRITTEDGSEGETGVVTDILPADPVYDAVYVCGPKAMMAAVAEWAERNGIPCQVSMEEHMGCGIGTCMGCVCAIHDTERKNKDGIAYKRICKEGPVFDSREVAF